MGQLNDGDFVFLDTAGIPWLCKSIEGQWWLCLWLGSQKRWITKRRCTVAETWWFPRNLPREHQELYFRPTAPSSAAILGEPAGAP